ncbi:MAG TPA: HAMP domain-containing sensor histidine kinase, partial [Phycisphaerales bacterium]|nr:HAMP domain-containing sensor histidine kinase [Phycisphaerales bacterium]
ESMARLGEFTSGAAHEMNNPLTIISGRAQFLAEKLKDPKQRDDAAAIVKAADALTDLVTQLHVVASPPRPRTAPVGLKTWAQGVVADARKRVGAIIPATLAVRIDVPESDAPFDGPQIARATVELLVNALQSHPRSGVVLKLRPEEPDPAAADRQVLRVWVIDDGRGMSDYTRKHACDPFFSSLPSGRRPGLGLALAKRLIEASGGSLDFDSKPDRGTTATFGIPTTPSEQVAAPPTVQAPIAPVGRAA